MTAKQATGKERRRDGFPVWPTTAGGASQPKADGTVAGPLFVDAGLVEECWDGGEKNPDPRQTAVASMSKRESAKRRAIERTRWQG